MGFQTSLRARPVHALSEGNRLYLHIFAWPFKHLYLDGLGDRVEYAQFLHDASEVRFKIENGGIRLDLPVQQPDVDVPVVEIFLKQ